MPLVTETQARLICKRPAKGLLLHQNESKEIHGRILSALTGETSAHNTKADLFNYFLNALQCASVVEACPYLVGFYCPPFTVFIYCWVLCVREFIQMRFAALV